MAHFIRIFITTMLIWYAYDETGTMTTIMFVLITIGIEALAFVIRKLQGVIASMGRVILALERELLEIKYDNVHNIHKHKKEES